MQLENTTSQIIARTPLTEDVDFEDNLEDLGDPVGEEDDKEAGEGAGDHFFAFFLGFFVGGACEHGESTHDEHAKEDEAGDGHKSGEKGVDDTTQAIVAAFETDGSIVGGVVDKLSHIYVP